MKAAMATFGLDVMESFRMSSEYQGELNAVVVDVFSYYCQNFNT